MQSSGHSLEAVARPSHTAQYTEAVYFLRAGSCELGTGREGGRRGLWREGEKGGGGVAADPRLG